MKGLVFRLFFSLKLFAAETAPFANLNQYFKYKGIDNSSFEINNKLYTLDDLQITRENLEIQLQIADISPYRSKLTQIEVLDIMRIYFESHLDESLSMLNQMKQEAVVAA